MQMQMPKKEFIEALQKRFNTVVVFYDNDFLRGNDEYFLTCNYCMGL
jgi:hypothetical protein